MNVSWISRVELVVGQLLEHLELLGLEELVGRRVDRAVAALQMLVEPAKAGHAQLGRVLVRARR